MSEYHPMDNLFLKKLYNKYVEQQTLAHQGHISWGSWALYNDTPELKARWLKKKEAKQDKELTRIGNLTLKEAVTEILDSPELLADSYYKELGEAYRKRVAELLWGK